MSIMNISEMIVVLRKYLLRLTALSLAVGLISMYVIDNMQTYTATLGFKYNHSEAKDGFAPDGVNKLDPYEIQNPSVIQGAIKKMNLDDKTVSVEGIRQNISISKVITDLDQEVSESAALLGEKYEVLATEYEMKYTYKAALGDEFGAKMFSAIIKEYDNFLLDKYYNKRTIADFSKIVADTTADYIDISDVMSTNLESIIENLSSLAESYPDFRSHRTGYSFSDLLNLYQNLYDIQYAKYYGNVRAGNLAKDKEMVIKSYQAKVKELSEDWDVSQGVAEAYKNEISTFYDSYKEAGLYRQASNMQTNLNSTNNRDEDVLDDHKIREFVNTYDSIVLNYTESATNASVNKRTIEYYNGIIESYENDNVNAWVKDRLLSANEDIFEEIATLSDKYAKIANESLDEFYHGKVNDDLQYLISPEVSADKPVKLIGVFMTILCFGLLLIGVFVYEIARKYIDTDDHSDEEEEEKIIMDTSVMGEFEKAVYEQYMNNFDEFYLVYQPIVKAKSNEINHYEAFIRWKSPTLGNVSPGNIIENIGKLNLFRQLNNWILKNVCENIKLRIENGEGENVIHVNCPHSEVSGFALNDILIKHITEFGIPSGCICMELDGNNMMKSMEDIILLSEMGIQICVDRFEHTKEGDEIIQVISPDYVKLSVDTLNYDTYATSEDEIIQAAANMKAYFAETILKCHKNGIELCICGVENQAQDETISSMEFDYKQGYFYGKPVRYE